MTTKDLLHHRLNNQKLCNSEIKNPGQVISWMGAMQAQEYAMAKWAVGLRLPGSNDTIIEKAFEQGKILRTHLLRPTWHFVTPEDIRWMLKLSAPRVHALNAFMYRKMDVDQKVFKKCAAIIEKVLSGKNLQREQIKEEFEKKKLICDGMRMSLIMMWAELEGLVCSGPRIGNQFSYALLEERVAPVKNMNEREALVELMRRYFKSRGPATLKDFTTWGSFKISDAKEALQTLQKEFQKIIYNGEEHFYVEQAILPVKDFENFLMPDYDEYGMSYKNRGALLAPGVWTERIRGGSPVFNRMIILNGVIKGTWERSFQGKNLEVKTHPFEKLNKMDAMKLKSAVKRFSDFYS